MNGILNLKHLLIFTKRLEIKEKLGFSKAQKTKKKPVKHVAKKIQQTFSEETEDERPAQKITLPILQKTIVTRKELEKWCT